MAYARGDRTAYERGRLTLNPFRHIDLFWTIVFPIFLLVATGGRFAIGMAKPVPVNFGNLRRMRLDKILVAVVGPLANLLFAWFLAVWFQVTGYSMLLYGVYLNLGLAFFNLIPIPPLDGSRILSGLLPSKLSRLLDDVEPFGFMIVLLLYMSGVLFALIMPPIHFCLRLFGLPPVLI
ncbi:MAG: site-2 protease family protein [Candidatus Omnitrophica bacterium]|nr:site-2 protease family protein [Candidatus Omnitrophota bacterium]